MAELERTRSLRPKRGVPVHFDVGVLVSLAERLGARPLGFAAPAAADARARALRLARRLRCGARQAGVAWQGRSSRLTAGRPPRRRRQGLAGPHQRAA
jgi:hypothetical protein